MICELIDCEKRPAAPSAARSPGQKGPPGQNQPTPTTHRANPKDLPRPNQQKQLGQPPTKKKPRPQKRQPGGFGFLFFL